MSTERDDDHEEPTPEEPAAEELESAESPVRDTAEELASAILDEPQVDVTQLYLNEIGQAPLLTAE